MKKKPLSNPNTRKKSASSAPKKTPHAIQPNSPVPRLQVSMEGNVPEPVPLEQILMAFIKSIGKMPVYNLQALSYLADLLAYERWGRTLTAAAYYYTNKTDSPRSSLYPKTLHVLRERKLLTIDPGNDGVLYTQPVQGGSFELNLSASAMELVQQMVKDCGQMDGKQLRRFVFRTKPLQAILRCLEEHKSMHQTILLEGDKRFDG